MGAKKPRHKSAPTGYKQPTTVTHAEVTKTPAVPETRHSGDHLRFSFAELDHQGSWPLRKAKTAELTRLLKKLQSLENMTVQQARDTHTLSSLNMEKCPNDAAAARLANQYEGLDVLDELRIEKSQSGRLLGRVEDRFFNIIWWDPSHDVWPEGKQKK